MQSTTTYSRGDIVIVPFAFSDRSGFKPRPAMVLSSPSFQTGRADVVVAALTSRVREPLLTGDYLIHDWQGCGLPKPTVATGILRTVKSFLVLRRVGALQTLELRQYDQVLRSSLGL